MSLNLSQDAVGNFHVSGSDTRVQWLLGALKKPNGGCSPGFAQGLVDIGSASKQAAMPLMLRAAACLWQSLMHDNTIEGGEDIITLEPRCS